MKKDLVFFGIQWSWKWTQAKKLLELYSDDYSYFSSWEVFRALTKSENVIWDYIKDILEKWILISNDITISIFNTYLQIIKESNKLMLLDGYPRNKIQIDNLFKYSVKNNRELFWVYFELWEKEAIQRMIDRWRKDDNEEWIKTRIKLYREETEPTIEYFDKKWTLIKINANQSIEDVFSDLIKVIK